MYGMCITVNFFFFFAIIGNDEVPFSPPPPVSPEGYIALTLKISNYSNNYVCSTVPADMLLRKRK